MKSPALQKTLRDEFPRGRVFAFGLTLILLLGLLASPDAPPYIAGAQQRGQRQRTSPPPKKPQPIQRRISTEPVVQAELRPSKYVAVSSPMTRTERDDPGEIVARSDRSKRRHRRPHRTDPREGRGGSQNQGGKTSEFGAPPATTFDPVTQTEMKLGNDPQIAVSEHFIVATEAHHVAFYNKHGDLLDKKPNFFGGFVPVQMSAKALFGPVLEPFLRDEGGSVDPSRKNPDDINRHLGHQTASAGLICDPNDPIAIGCIDEAYDTRVTYDRERHRFWIVSALRDQVWGTGNSICDRDHFCASQESGLPRRFVAVAVTETEDPRDGFHEFVLVDEYADWPRFALNGPFLIISHNNSNNVFLFDAQKLADGNRAHELVGQGTFYDSEFDVDNIYPVVQHDKRDENDRRQDPFIPTLPPTPGGSKKVPTFLLGIKGNKIKVFYFDPVLINPITAVVMHPSLSNANIDIPGDAPHVLSNPVYRNGFIYVVGDQCVDGDFRTCNHEIRLLKIPVFRGAEPIASMVFASPLASLGFRGMTFGGGIDDEPFSLAGPSFEIPAVEVNKNDDVVIVYGRAGPGLNLLVDAPGAFYRLVKKNGDATDGIVHVAICGPKQVDKLPCGQRQHDQNNIDVAGIAVDPADDRTIWMAHAIADGTMTGKKHFRMVIGQVKP